MKEAMQQNNFPQEGQNKKEFFAALSLENVKQQVIDAMEREEREGHKILTIVPVSLIDKFSRTEDGGIDIHCENGHNYSLGKDGYIYDIGIDA